MHILDPHAFNQALKAKGYRSIFELAQELGIHRNTIHHYLSGHGVFPENLDKILDALALKPAECIVEKPNLQSPSLEAIAPLIDQLSSEFHPVSFILFGSRASKQARRYSDWDVGVFSNQGISHALYRKLRRRADDLSEAFPFMVEIVNLNDADPAFLKAASRNWQFLAGRLRDQLALEQKVRS